MTYGPNLGQEILPRLPERHSDDDGAVDVSAANYPERIILNAWNAYLIDATDARKAIGGWPDDITVNHLIVCRELLEQCGEHLDLIEEQLPAARAHVDSDELARMRAEIGGWQ